MTEPTESLGDLLDALITAGHEFESAQQMEQTILANRRLMELRAQILARYDRPGDGRPTMTQVHDAIMQAQHRLHADAWYIAKVMLSWGYATEYFAPSSPHE